jgi:hypothetical protein
MVHNEVLTVSVKMIAEKSSIENIKWKRKGQFCLVQYKQKMSLLEATLH